MAKILFLQCYSDTYLLKETNSHLFALSTSFKQIQYLPISILIVDLITVTTYQRYDNKVANEQKLLSTSTF